MELEETYLSGYITSIHNNITCGVLQVSILGPLLFLFYINDLTTLSDTMLTIMFAVDTSILINR